MKSQSDRILDYLRSGHGITPLGALSKFDTLRLSGRILELRRLGYEIETHTLKVGKKHVALYRIAGKADRRAA